MEGRVIGALGRYQEFWQAVGVTPPLVVSLTLTGVKGWKVLRGPYDPFDSEARLDRDIISPQEAVLSDLAVPSDAVLRPLFDFVWCGGGWPGSPNYRDGRWVTPTR